MTNPYNVLGVQPGCSESELKSAYKKLAMKHHPDRGGDEEEFKRVTEAYEMIKNGGQQQPGHDSFHFNDFMHQFNQQFRGGPFEFNFSNNPRNPRHQGRNADININYNITLNEVVTGVNKIIRVQLPRDRYRDVSIQIPPGVRHGDKIRFNECGDDHLKGLQPGHLYVTVLEQRHFKFERHVHDCYTGIELELKSALLGDTVTVDGLEDKKYSLKIPSGTQPDQKFRISGAGFPIINTNKRGDLIVVSKIKIPKNIDPTTRIQEL